MDPIKVIIENWQLTPWYRDWFPLVLSVLALIISIIAIFLPYLVSIFKKSKFHGKMFNIYAAVDFKFYSNGKISASGIGYFLKTSIVVSNKSFEVKQVDVNIKYPGDVKMYKGTIFRSNKFSLTWKDDLSFTDGDYKINISSEQDILSLSYISKDDSKNYYISFFVDKATYEDFEEIELTFTDYKNEGKKLKLQRKDIDERNSLIKSEIWLKK